METPASAQNNAHLPTSLNSEGEGGDVGESEVPIVATNAGNAAGAKGHRFEIVNRENMPRRRADYVHDHVTFSLHTVDNVSQSIVNDSNWEPDGVTRKYPVLRGRRVLSDYRDTRRFFPLIFKYLIALNKYQ